MCGVFVDDGCFFLLGVDATNDGCFFLLGVDATLDDGRGIIEHLVIPRLYGWVYKILHISG